MCVNVCEYVCVNVCVCVGVCVCVSRCVSSSGDIFTDTCFIRRQAAKAHQNAARARQEHTLHRLV